MFYFTNEKTETFFSLNNGEHFFKTVLQPKSKTKTHVQIFKQKPFHSISFFDNLFQKNGYEDQPLLSLISSQILIGESLSGRERTQWEGSHGPQYNGNSLLIQINNLQYLYIGDIIYTFELKADLVHYESPIGISSITYPWAQDEDKNIYLLAYETMIKLNSENEYLLKVQGKDPYMFKSLGEKMNVNMIINKQ